MEVIFEAMNYFNELFSCYINHTVVVVSAAEYIKDDIANIPALAPVCDFQIVAVSLAPLVIKAKHAIG
jgi:hypothetical protein